MVKSVCQQERKFALPKLNYHFLEDVSSYCTPEPKFPSHEQIFVMTGETYQRKGRRQPQQLLLGSRQALHYRN
jgi:hypothetical protein